MKDTKSVRLTYCIDSPARQWELNQWSPSWHTRRSRSTQWMIMGRFVKSLCWLYSCTECGEQ